MALGVLGFCAVASRPVGSPRLYVDPSKMHNRQLVQEEAAIDRCGREYSKSKQQGHRQAEVQFSL